jgi:hypothetical protein
MGTLRAANFDRLLDVYSEIKNLAKRCDYSLRSAINKISRKLWSLTNWQAENEMYAEYLGYAATRLNILYNSNIDEAIKIIILKIYNKITELLPDDFQLLLFAEGCDNLVKVFSRSKNYVKPTILVVSNYIQFTFNLRQCDNVTK